MEALLQQGKDRPVNLLLVVVAVVLEVLGVVQVNLENNFFQEDLLEF